MDELEKYLEMKRRIADIQKKKDQMEGALLESKRVLADKFKVGDLNSAKKLMKKMDDEIEHYQEKLDSLENEFEEEYRKFMEG